MTHTDLVLPPLDWTTTLPETVSFHEENNGKHPIFVLADDSADISPHVTYADFARASRRVPQLLGLTEETAVDKPVVAILASMDALVYHTVMLGLMQIGAVPFPISTRNTAEAVTHLVGQTAAARLIMSSKILPAAPAVTAFLTGSDSNWTKRIYEPPVLSDLYPHLNKNHAGDKALMPAYVGTVKPDINSLCIYLHSSGSTGLPKAIPLTHYEVVKYMRYPASTVFRPQNGRIKFSCVELPPSHGMSFIFQLCIPLFHGAAAAILYPIVETPFEEPPVVNPESVIKHIERTGADACFTYPAYLHAWVHDKHNIDVLKKLHFVEYSGGALSPAVGEILRKEGVTLRLLYGGTEFGPAAMCSVRPGDENEWEYLEVAEESNPYFAPQGDGTYELQFINSEEQHMSVTNIPGINGYATSDLMIPHPTKGYLWKLAGRIDDIIIHSTGYNTVPAPIEFAIQGSPYVHGVVVFGAGRIQPGVLIEPCKEHSIDTRDTKATNTLRDLIWPAIEKANSTVPTFSKIRKAMIVFTSPDKPLPRTPKMTIVKKTAWALYAEEIDSIYSANEALGRTDALPR